MPNPLPPTPSEALLQTYLTTLSRTLHASSHVLTGYNAADSVHPYSATVLQMANGMYERPYSLHIGTTRMEALCDLLADVEGEVHDICGRARGREEGGVGEVLGGSMAQREAGSQGAKEKPVASNVREKLEAVRGKKKDADRKPKGSVVYSLSSHSEAEDEISLWESLESSNEHTRKRFRAEKEKRAKLAAEKATLGNGKLARDAVIKPWHATRRLRNEGRAASLGYAVYSMGKKRVEGTLSREGRKGVKKERQVTPEFSSLEDEDGGYEVLRVNGDSDRQETKGLKKGGNGGKKGGQVVVIESEDDGILTGISEV